MGCVNGATGSHQRFHAEDTEDFLCAYNKDAVNEFSKLIEPVLKQMHDLRQENVKLALTRDTLLPKLMSGELKINEIDC
jgi:type I restriction enzyme S subunit